MSGRSKNQTAGAALSQPWIVVTLLALLSTVSLLDRMILSLLIAPMKAEFNLSDVQISLLIGIGFVAFYSIASIPAAHLADRSNRVRLITIGVMLWSSMTLMASFTHNFTLFVVTRAGLALGEAVLTPTAISLIGDMFPQERRALPTSVYVMASGLMTAGSLAIGGVAVALATTLSPDLGMPAWRLTLLLVSLPGFLLAAIFAMVREPKREQSGIDKPDTTFVGMFQHFRRHAGLYVAVPVVVGLVLTSQVALFTWAPTMLERDYGMSVPAAGAIIGSSAMVGTLIGSLSFPWLLRVVPGASVERRLAKLTLMYVSASPVLAAGLSSGNIYFISFGILLGATSAAGCTVLVPMLVQAITPARFRARLVAMCILLISLVSWSIGPLGVSLIASQNADKPLAASLATLVWIVSALALPACAGAIFAASRREPRDANHPESVTPNPAAAAGNAKHGRR